MRTQVAIVGGGPAGLLLGRLLHGQGIDTILVERRSKAHVLSRIRAGVLEHGLVGLLRMAGVADRLDREGIVHDGTLLSFDDLHFRVDFRAATGHGVTVYGQTEVTRDLYAARDADDAKTFFEVDDVTLHELDTERPHVAFRHEGRPHRIDCDFVAGCDGFHGISRETIPGHKRIEFQKDYPFGWLGILSQSPPVRDELIYASSSEGFALCSMRNPQLSRYYIQCHRDERPEDWSAEAFWAALKARLPEAVANDLVTGPPVEMSVAPLRSFVCEPMRWGRLFLCGDAAHIVPPTGAKGLNLAASDINYLFEGLVEFYQNGNEAGLDAYSGRALARVWKAERFSWWFTTLMHRFPEQTGFDRRMQQAEIDFLRTNEAAQSAMAQNYVGLPY